MTIKLGSRSKYTTPKFVGNTAEEAVHFIRSFWTLEIKLEYCKDWAFTKKVRTVQKQVLVALDPTDTNFAICKDEYDIKITECSASMRSLPINIYQLFKDFLG